MSRKSISVTAASIVVALCVGPARAQCSIKRVMADGDLVAVHSHCRDTPRARGSAVVDIFRVDGGSIVEHWDVEQGVPARARNRNTMF